MTGLLIEDGTWVSGSFIRAK